MKNAFKTAAERAGEFTGFHVLKVWRKNYALYPLALIHVFALTILSLTAARTLIKSPDVTINKTRREMPFERLLTQDGHAVPYRLISFQDAGKWLPDPDRPDIDEPNQRFR